MVIENSTADHSLEMINYIFSNYVAMTDGASDNGFWSLSLVHNSIHSSVHGSFVGKNKKSPVRAIMSLYFIAI